MAACNSGYRFTTFSRDKFINVSLQLVENKSFPGLPDPNGQGLLAFGIGGYRHSNVYLAYVLSNQIETRAAYWFYQRGVHTVPQ